MSNTLGTHIREIRKSKKLTLKQLSEISGISIPYLSDVERDAVNPSWKMLQSIAKSLKISLPEIVDFNNELDNRLLDENRRLHEILDNIGLLVSTRR